MWLVILLCLQVCLLLLWAVSVEKDGLRPALLGANMKVYPHMCRDGHDEIGFSGDDERCPICRLGFTRDDLEAVYSGILALRQDQCPLLADELQTVHDRLAALLPPEGA